eukprot:scaffold16440_cov146-Skeletonema_dohrnii-CCMP3373.AAC.4
MTRTKPTPTRSVSVHFAATSQLILLPNANRSWYSAEDEARFKRETSQHATQLRTTLALGFAHPNDLSEDDLINCTGIEPLVLFSRSILRQLKEKKLAHIDGILAAQRHLNPSDLARVSHRSSDDARKRAYVVASLQL